ncbi:sensor domain-containing diguanylate cyclase [Baekduia sp.]|jgi:diguanylate cyclase (GGDEF)-like protein|uniref:GGDEF domain-containing protein n=1 Tax=Baekduia sp. TaxID=2600305 RepID=UPI002E0A6CAF|nr:sensor domain-containing diguanylate cyclase [Baekduia sp.]
MPAVSATRVVRGLESIIDAVAGVLAEQSLDATLQSMARALRGIVPYTSLAIYEVDAERQLLIPVFAEGQFVEETLADPPRLNDSITGKVVRSRQIVHLEPGHPWFGRYIIADTPQDLEAIVFCPLIVADRVIGTLNVWREDSAPELAGTIPTFSPEEAQLIKRFASLAALAYDNARRRELLSEQARTDELTGLFNRRHFHERLAAELARAQRDGAPVGLVLLDVDDFKRVNDVHGHPVGDQVLVAFGEVLAGHVRAGDVVCRTGGEEFGVILPNADEREAAHCADRLVGAVRDAVWSIAGPMTASAGVAVAPDDAGTVATLFKAADECLLMAKASGKDRVVLRAQTR